MVTSMDPGVKFGRSYVSTIKMNYRCDCRVLSNKIMRSLFFLIDMNCKQYQKTFIRLSDCDLGLIKNNGAADF